ncbi:RNA-binding protein 41 isoform X2 [Heliangelus exortis]|uniref:RNA-binding protein 41 isoform X2 n=1 Tax=Heliangelus exortis TaxID=472823 RepID=UPI003A9355C7
MRRVNSSLSSDELLLEDLETEGERQLKSLLHHQLDTTVSIEQCKSKQKCFAPSAFYKPFGEEAAGALTLSQFQALQESNKETATLRELGLSDSEILLWKNRDSTGKGSGLGAAPEATQDRLHAIQEKMEERQRILALPQRFAGSKQLSRREMEIENALFQGTDRHSFLRALYHQDDTQRRVTDENDPMVDLECVYQDVLSKKCPEDIQLTKSDPCVCPSLAAEGAVAQESSLPDKEEQAEQARSPSLPAAKPHQSPPRPVIIRDPVEFVPEEEICKNRLSEEELRHIPRFSSYHPGEPSKVLYLKNLAPRVTMEDLVSLFARFQKEESPPIQFRLLSGRMRGQAFITFPDPYLSGDRGCPRQRRQPGGRGSSWTLFGHGRWRGTAAPTKPWRFSTTRSGSSGPSPSPLTICTAWGRSCWRSSRCRPLSASTMTRTAKRRRRRRRKKRGKKRGKRRRKKRRKKRKRRRKRQRPRLQVSNCRQAAPSALRQSAVQQPALPQGRCRPRRQCPGRQQAQTRGHGLRL